MKRNEFFLSVGGESAEKIHCVAWEPDGECCAVLQIVHGMIEYALRYDHVAEFFCKRGIAVVSHDHPGHGLTAPTSDDLGYIPRKGGSELLVECVHAVTEHIIATYKGLPRFILGHSMGSFVTRRFLTTEYARGLSGAVIVGTGDKSLLTLKAAKAVSAAVGLVKGQRHRSMLITGLSFGSYNKRCRKEEGGMAWTTTDPDMLKAHDGDPLASFIFTVSAYGVMFDTIEYIEKRRNVEKMSKELPVFIMSGEEDPVGDYGKAPRELAKKYTAMGLRDVQVHMYADDRHEILNETDRDKVMEDLYVWLKAHMN